MQDNTVKTEPISLYIHWPFCKSKCPYCDFNSHVREAVDHDRWRNALLKELHYIGSVTKGRRLQSVFFGGGTPSLMEPETVAALVDQLGSYWTLKDVEISMEANPNSVEAERFKAFRAAGINRLSLGIQSLNEDALKFLGRIHNKNEALKAIKIAADTFERYSFDLIYARAQQSVQDWETELKEAMPYIRDHVSLYQLTIEKGTAFHTAYQRREFTLPDNELSAELFLRTNEMMSQAGLERYEVSNHAKPGQECMHNLVYWRYRDYAGIGPGAHGRVTIDQQRLATKCYRAPETWLDQVEQHGYGLQKKDALVLKEQIVEAIMMGLRLHEGISIERFRSSFSTDIVYLLGESRLKSLVSEGYIELTDTSIRATDEGILRLNSVLRFITDPLVSKGRQAL